MHIRCSVHPAINSHFDLHTLTIVEAVFKLFRLVLSEKCGNIMKTRFSFSAVPVSSNFGMDMVKTTMKMAMPANRCGDD